MANPRLDAIPNVPAGTPPYLRPFLEKLKSTSEIRFGQSKNQLDRSPTVRELQSAGLIQVSGRRLFGNGAGISDLITTTDVSSNDVVVDSPQNVTAAISSMGVLLQWTPLSGVSKLAISHAEIWRSGPIDTADIATYPGQSLVEDGDIVSAEWLNPLETATLPPFGLAGVTSGFMFSERLPPSRHFVYWVRFISHKNIPGPFHAVAGTKVSSGVDIESIIDALEDQANDGALNSVLSGAIDQVPSFSSLRAEFDAHKILQDISEAGEIVINKSTETYATARVLTEETERITALSALASRTTQVESELYTPTSGILGRATALENFRAYVEDNGSGGFLANASYIQGLEAELQTLENGQITLQGRATALETFRAYVENDGAGGYLASSSKFTGLEATVNGISANYMDSAEVTAAVNGQLTGRVYNRIDLNGRITGLEYFDGVGSNTELSQFIIKSDVFQIRTTTSDKQVMAINADSVSFDLDVINLNGTIPSANIGDITADKITITGLGGVSSIAEVLIGTGTISNAMIGNEIKSNTYNPTTGVGWQLNKNGTLNGQAVTLRNTAGEIVFSASGMNGTHINDLSVDTLKIGTNAVIVPAANSQDTGASLTGSWAVVASVTVNLGTGSFAPNSVFAQAYGNAQATGSIASSVAMRLRSSSGETGGDVGITAAEGASMALGTAHRFVSQSGTTTFYVEMYVTGGAGYLARGCGIFVQGVRR